MAIARRCDRCGEYFSPAEEKGEYCRFSNPTVMTGESYSQNRSIGKMVKFQDNVLEIFKEDGIDLCPKCTWLMKKFMQNKKFVVYMDDGETVEEFMDGLLGSDTQEKQAP